MEDREQKIRFCQGMIARLRYAQSRFPWRDRVFDILNGESLSLATEQSHHKALQGTSWHSLFYEHWPQFSQMYIDFVRWLASECQLYGVVYQKVPTFRVHASGSHAVGEWHRDSDYGHAVGEYNFWLPLTRAFGTNTIWIGDSPVESEPGEVIVFDGVNLLHGNKVNDTGHTRVSFDFRLAGFQPSGRQSVHAGRSMTIGDYYEELK